MRKMILFSDFRFIVFFRLVIATTHFNDNRKAIKSIIEMNIQSKMQKATAVCQQMAPKPWVAVGGLIFCFAKDHLSLNSNPFKKNWKNSNQKLMTRFVDGQSKLIAFLGKITKIDV